MIRNDTKNGGAVSPCALMLENPISSRMVGRNTTNVSRDRFADQTIFLPGKEANPTFVLKYMS